MTIKEIKEKYKRYECDYGEQNKFVVYNWKSSDIGKMVVVVNYDEFTGWKNVVQAVRVSDGKCLISDGRSRPCDNLRDAIDVAMDMIDSEIWNRERKIYNGRS